MYSAMPTPSKVAPSELAGARKVRSVRTRVILVGISASDPESAVTTGFSSQVSVSKSEVNLMACENAR